MEVVAVDYFTSPIDPGIKGKSDFHSYISDYK